MTSEYSVPFMVSEPFAPRRIHFRGMLSVHNWRMKCYEIVYGPGPIDWPVYEAVLPETLTALPQPPQAAHRPGVGFIIAHQGRAWHYLLVHWWDNENELCQRVFVRRFGPGEKWRLAVNESFCVWDLEVLWFEREVYIAQVLGKPHAPDLDAYLTAHLEVSA